MSSTVTVSNGEEFFRISPVDLPSAKADGFYRPLQRGLTIVSNNEHLFEIPLSDLNAAQAEGYQDLLEQERRRLAKKPSRLMAAGTAVSANNAVFADEIVGDTDRLLNTVSQAELKEDEDRIARQQELEAAEGAKWYLVFSRHWLSARRVFLERQLGSHGISIAIHVAIFLLMASLVMVDNKKEEGLVLSASPASEEIIQDVIIEPSLEITDPTEVEQSDAPPENVEVEMAMTDAVEIPNFAAAISGDAVKMKAPAAAKDPGEGKTMPKKRSSVFGTKKTANDYVFVIDNSNSMSRGRFETALHELLVAISGLTKKQRFYVIFYSDTAYGMMYPNPVRGLQFATDINKQNLARWLNTIPLCLKTNGKEAIQAAFSLQPDVIYVLGDGAFTDGASKHFSQVSPTKTVLHTRGMEVSAKNAQSFQMLANAHGGTYKDVGVDPRAMVLAKQNPRPKNSIRNGFWGITLPLQKKPK